LPSGRRMTCGKTKTTKQAKAECHRECDHFGDPTESYDSRVHAEILPQCPVGGKREKTERPQEWSMKAITFFLDIRGGEK
jgi:hypothetical protein